MFQVLYKVYSNKKKKSPSSLERKTGRCNNKGNSARYISLAYPVRIKSARKFSGVSVTIFTPACTT